MSINAPSSVGSVIGDTDVMSVMIERHRAGTRPGQHQDGYRVALVIEGGGMRGVYVGGMARALGALGLRNSFDEIVAVSAGAFTGAGLASDRTDHLARAYYDDLAVGAFVDYRRMLSRRGPLVSLDFLLDEVMIKRYGFEWSMVLDSDLPLRPVATALDTLSSCMLSDLRTPDDWRNALLASARIPLWAGPPIELHGRRWVDGFVTDPLPVASAVEAGATHVLVLLARAPHERLSPSSRVTPLMRSHLNRLAPGLAAAMALRGLRHRESTSLIGGGGLRRGAARIMGLRPVRGFGIRSLTSDVSRLRQGGEAGEAVVHHAVEAARVVHEPAQHNLIRRAEPRS
ncbi:MAG TPA: patatin-like phospholipase family protein [Mycobacteriales bacterium]|jgi:predicted patatin/cPLA2 family phospholipase|nr:patatin-like phospholipase family protein [Mycobacteriales bacterium]